MHRPTRNTPLKIAEILQATVLCLLLQLVMMADAHAQEQVPRAPNVPSRKIEITFGGSLCPVCLVAFQKRLISTEGVLGAQVESFRKDAHEEHSGHPPKRAHAIIEFSPGKISQAELETIVRQNDFQFIKTLNMSATNP